MSLSFKQVDELINEAAKNNRLWDCNGGYAYIQVSATTLLVVDYTNSRGIRVDLRDGTDYFRSCNGIQFVQSEFMRKQGSRLEHVFDLV